MSNTDHRELDFQNEEFDPDPYGFDRQLSGLGKNSDTERRQVAELGTSVTIGAHGNNGRLLEAVGTSESAERGSCFSAPDPWPDTHRAAPSELLRCGLFRPRRRDGELLASQRLDSNANVELIVKGPELSQLDLDTWTAVVHLLRFGAPTAELSRLKLLSTWGRGRGGHANEVARSSLRRLQECEVALAVQNRPSRKHPEQQPDRCGFKGRLIDRVEWKKEGDEHPVSIPITLNPKLSVLFEPRRRTILFPSHRAAIGDNPVALWFYAMLRSHRQVLPLPLLYYYRMSGSGSSVSDFTRQVKRALTLLADKQIIFSAELRKGDFLFIQRNRPTAARKLPAEDTEWCALASRQAPIPHDD